MKKMKKFLAMFLALAMVLGMSVTTFAATTDTDGADNVVGTSDDRGDIVVHGIEDKTLTNVKAYPIVTAKYDKNGNFEGYDNPYEITLTAPTKAQLEDIDITELSADSFDLTYQDTFGSAKNVYVAQDKKVGMYLIVVPSADATTYSRAVASIYYSNGGTSNVLNSADLTLTTAISETAPWIKKDTEVIVEKTVNNVAGNTASVGEDLDFEVVISPVPNYSGANPKLAVTDRLSTGLQYNNDAKIYTRTVGTVDGKPANVDTEIIALSSLPKYKAGVLTVDFVSTGDAGAKTYLLSDHVGETIVIKYTAKLTEAAVINGLRGNTNTVTLDYTRNSDVVNDDAHGTDVTYTYTFDIDGKTTGSITNHVINKVGEVVDTETGEREALPGATFTLYQNKKDLVKGTDESEEDFRTRITNTEGNEYTNDSFTGTTMTDKNGQIQIKGLAAGTYYLKETEAPEDYSINTHVFKIVIDAVVDKKVETKDGIEIDKGTGELSSWSITIDDQPIATFTLENNGTIVVPPASIPGIDIVNTKLSSLPSTGGIGTTVFTIGGCAIMIIAAGLYFSLRRKNAK